MSRGVSVVLVLSAALAFSGSVSALDCNGNGVPDGDDILAGTSKDCNGNGVPDECDITDSMPVINEAFDDVAGIGDNGWVIVNHSDPVGTTTWSQGTPTLFSAHQGASNAYIGVNFNSCGNGPGADTISNWLIGPEMWLTDGSQISFYTRTTTNSVYPDRLQVRLSLNGSSTDVGTSAEDVGDFSTLLLDINPLLEVGGYPEYWKNYTIALSGVGAPQRGRFAFRYYVTDAGAGPNSNYVGIDTVTLTGVAVTYSRDFNGNRVPDECDIAGGWSRDDNANGVPDECEVLGYAVGWGLDGNGQAGAVVPDCLTISAGGSHSLAVKADASIMGWGSNAYSMMDDIPAGNDFRAVAAGFDHSIALRYDGSVVCWGANDRGQCNVPGGAEYVAVAAGRKFSLAITADGTLVGWGANDVGQINVPAGNDFVRVSAGDYHALALRSDNSMAAWGISGSDDRAVARAGNEFTAVAAGASHSAALKFDGSVVAWGNNDYGQVDNAPTASVFKAIAAGGNLSLAIRHSGAIVGWGSNSNNEIADIPAGYDYMAIAAGGGHALAVTACPLSADLTEDCVVDANDLLVLASQWLEFGVPGDCFLSADLRGGDCYVDVCDYAKLAEQWLCSAEAADPCSVPTYNLFFSEYVEGSGDNKAVEIYNGGAVPVNLGMCHINAYHNGSVTPTYIISLNAEVLGAGEVFVVGNCCAILPELLARCDQLSTSIQFNGNDALELVCDGRTVDVIGQIGFAPPAGYWGTGDITTKDHTLRRKCSVTSGDTNGLDEFFPFIEWEGFSQDTFDGLGEHCP